MEDPRIISALFIFLKMAYYNVLINNMLLLLSGSGILKVPSNMLEKIKQWK